MSTKYTGALSLLVLLSMATPVMAVDLTLGLLNPFYRTVDPGVPVSIAYRVDHPGSEALTATVTVALPAGARYERATGSGWNCAPSADAVTCTQALPGGGYYPLTVVIVTPPSLDGYIIDEVATLTTSLPDTNATNNLARFLLIGYRTREVTTPDDFGEGSLRAAIAWANDQTDPVLPFKIRFAQPMIIEPRTPLPVVRGCRLVIDGGTFADEPQEPAHFERPRRVEILGHRTPFGSGITIAAPCTRGGGALALRGLAISGFPENGLEFADGTGMVSVFGCFIGTDAGGTVARPNRLRGIAFASASASATIEQSIISGNRYSGIAVWDARMVAVRSSRIGVGVSEAPLPNGSSGIFVNGGTLDSAFNTIMNNGHFGIAVGPRAEHTVSFDDRLRDNGGIAIDWGLDGPTPVDLTGRMPPIPRIIEAVYLPSINVTRVRATVEIGATAHPSFFAVRTTVIDPRPNESWRAGERIEGTLSGRLTFEIKFLGDHRGRKFVAQTLRAAALNEPSIDSSELSEPVEVR